MRLINFLEALVKQSVRTMLLVYDNLGVHHSAPVKEWLAAHVQQMEVCHLSSYAPGMNPDIGLNGDLKLALETRLPCRTKDKLHNPAMGHMTATEKNPDESNPSSKTQSLPMPLREPLNNADL